MSTNEINPYVGPRSFQSRDQSLFFGRTFAAEEVFNLISAHPLLLLYSPSGAGKTSLINAAVIPRLESENHEVLPRVRVGNTLTAQVPYDDVKNIYLLNCLINLAEPNSADVRALMRMSLRDFLSSRLQSSTERDRLVILIFDQFEEMFTAYPERWEDRPEFFQEVRLTLRHNPALRIMFVMREEFIAELDPFAPMLPQKLRTRFRLEPLRREAALEAATKPLESTGRRFEHGVAEVLVDSLTKISVVSGNGTKEVPGEFVEPVQLQVVCRSIWDSLSEDVTVIDERVVRDHGDIDKALSGYYEECLKETVSKSGMKAGRLRNWFESVLITPAGTRAQVYLNESGSMGLPRSVIDMFLDSHLIRIEFARGAQWCELTNDRFIKPILNSNHRWRNGLGVLGRELEILNAKAREWLNSPRVEGFLNESELSQAEGWVSQAEDEGLPISSSLLSLVKASQVAIKNKTREQAIAARQQRLIEIRLRRWNFILAIILIAVVIFTIVKLSLR
jgi:hypothetical protein